MYMYLDSAARRGFFALSWTESSDKIKTMRGKGGRAKRFSDGDEKGQRKNNSEIKIQSGSW